MLDLLFNPLKAERHPIEIALIGVFYSSISILLGLWIFGDSASLAIVFLTVLSCLYVVQGAIKMEEKKEKNYNTEKWMLKEHKGLIILILALFIGFTLSFTFWSLFLPENISSKVFELQGISIDKIKMATGSATNFSSPLKDIFLNNFKIVLISLVFALFYGAGAVYVLVWNASVMGFAIGTVAKSSLGIIAIPFVLLKYFLHGIPEMVAYIVAAVAGGILYFALIKGDLVKKESLRRILVDVTVLFSISVLILIIAALIEVYISAAL